MSLVGPRPHAVAHDRFFGERVPGYHRRFVARPGVSGLAQVRGARGETPRIEDMQRRVELDLEYIRHASLEHGRQDPHRDRPRDLLQLVGLLKSCVGRQRVPERSERPTIHSEVTS